MPSTSSRRDTLVWGDNQLPYGHYCSAPREQHAPVTGDPSHSVLRWTGGPNRESYVPVGSASSASSWINTSSFDPSFSVYGGDAWTDNWNPDEARFWPQFSGPGGDADRLGTNLTRMEVAAPMLEQSFLLQGALSAPQRCPPISPSWIQAPGPSWQPSTWNHPLATFSETTGQSGHGVLPTGHLPSVTSNSVQSSTHGNLAPATPSTSQPQNGRSGLSLCTDTFQCLWMGGVTRCTAFVAGDRRSVTSHLRDEHAFTCDGMTIACAWGQCTALPMQRRNIPRHIVACHLEIRVTCPECDITLSRADAKKKHQLACPRTRMPVVVDAGGDHGRLFF